MSRILNLLPIVFYFQLGLAVALAGEPPVDILVDKDLTEFLITGMDLQREITSLGQKKIVAGTRKGGMRFRCHYFMKGVVPSVLARVFSPTGVLSYQEEKYKGEFLIIGPNKNRKCDLVNRVLLEKYVSVILPKEMNAVWPIEALKAQAVAGRSYALFQMVNRKQQEKLGRKIFYDLENSEKHQVNGTLFDETAKTALAAKSTAGEILIFEDRKELIVEPIFFHARCGGVTNLPEYVWSNSVPGYQKVLCPFCYNQPGMDWSMTLSKIALEKLLFEKQDSKEATVSPMLSSLEDDDTQFVIQQPKSYATEIRHLKKPFLRKYFGKEKLLSNRFVIKPFKDDFMIEGKGNGHGVGLCQMGALELAKRGWDYVKILQYYFPEHKIKNNYAGISLP